MNATTNTGSSNFTVSRTRSEPCSQAEFQRSRCFLALFFGGAFSFDFKYTVSPLHAGSGHRNLDLYRTTPAISLIACTRLGSETSPSVSFLTADSNGSLTLVLYMYQQASIHFQHTYIHIHTYIHSNKLSRDTKLLSPYSFLRATVTRHAT